MNNIRLNRKENINVKSVICQLHYFWNKFLFDKMMIFACFVLCKFFLFAKLDFYISDSVKQQSTIRPIAPISNWTHYLGFKPISM